MLANHLWVRRMLISHNLGTNEDQRPNLRKSSLDFKGRNAKYVSLFCTVTQSPYLFQYIASCTKQAWVTLYKASYKSTVKKKIRLSLSSSIVCVVNNAKVFVNSAAVEIQENIFVIS